MNSDSIRILHVVGYLGQGGDTTAITNVLDFIKKNNKKVEFEFLTHEGYDEEYVEKARTEGIKVYSLPGDVRKLGIIRYYKEMNCFLKKKRYDCIHFHTSFQSCIGLLAAKNNRITKRVSHSHTTAVQRECSVIKKTFYLPVCRLLIKILSTNFIACSDIAAKNLFGNNKNIKIIYNGLDIEKIKNVNTKRIKNILDKINYREGFKIVGHVGSFSEMKNQIFTVELAKRLKEEKIIFILLGNGQKFDYIDKYVTNEGLINVHLFGKVKNVNDYMKIFDYLLLPSKHGEGLPVVLIEQQIINNDCICITNDNVTNEANLGNVIYLNIKNPNNWIDILTKNKKNKKNIKIEEFDINNTAEEWLSIYYK